MILARINEKEELMLKKYRSERYRQLAKQLANRERFEDINVETCSPPYHEELEVKTVKDSEGYILDKEGIDYTVKHMKFYLLNIRRIFETTDVQTANQKLWDGWELLDIHIYDIMKNEVLYILGLRTHSSALGHFFRKNCKVRKEKG